MALCYRLLGNRQLCGSFVRGLYSQPCRCVSLRVTQYEPPPSESHDERNARLGRPQSPHLTIIKYQLTTVLSISHRMTGLALSVYMTTLGLGTLVSPYHFTDYITWIQELHLNPVLIAATKAIIAFPLAYHTCNGVRHLVWDLGKALTIKEVYYTGYAMLAATSIMTAWLMSL
ncbi:succinate dehydrogenase cytochrome b560 subunit, mitochondrial-like [Schistocerca americana]|uniref:succinate dehydrogenase cytochrome b560 subunit, mitochondrial-like n=1 Tax=Schistocerca americana TaxID=7009 RepID=UPI001F4FB14D|nr:succinate dehydrogenase cytochrome b560 subunit, mitochondrial-like [Schistocerca americana]XP_049853997.1 succinate dehydrogenase cytochrome b560 subunit, mitochondrial-like [Schistocerca gregaria]XP_049951121.1 succinate dehydrogenase cytochrome b560 subunit, mitochondrial-like [Schistocerca serialis cubense]